MSNFNPKATQLRCRVSGRPRLYALGSVCWCVFTAAALTAAAAPWMVLPQSPAGTPAYSAANGLQLAIEYPLGLDLGYVPVQFKLDSATPAASPMAITIRFQANAARYGSREITVEEDFEIPLGATSSSFTLQAPRYENWHLIQWEVWVDGRRDRQLCTTIGQSGNNESVSVLTSRSLRTSQLNTILARIDSTRSTLNRQTRALSDWPKRWIEYNLLDLAMVDARDLIVLQRKHAEAANALRRWVRSGGNIWVERGDAQSASLRAIDRFFNPSSSDQDDAGGSDRWHYVSLGEQAQLRIESLLEISGIETALNKNADDPTAEDRADVQAAPPLDIRSSTRRRRFTDTRKRTSKPGFVLRDYGLGTITAFLPSPMNRQAHGVLDSLVMDRLNWVSRHGLAPSHTNSDFNNWLIPGVGVAPVGGFQLLISVFVIGIGPLNYWLLARAKKLPLLLITVPASAALVTLLLFTYGYLSDGFGVRARARSVTMLDQANGECATCARLTYYASLAPREGLTFSDQTAVFPIAPPGWGNDARRARANREILWDDATQQLSRGWLATRTPAQLLTVSAKSTKKHLGLRRTASGLYVANRLGSDVQALAIEDHQGQIYWATELDDDGSTTLEPVEYKTVAADLRSLFLENEPQFPVGGYVDGPTFATALEDNLLETQLAATVSPIALGLGRGRYVAVVERAPELEFGLEAIREKASFHVVKGTFAPIPEAPAE